MRKSIVLLVAVAGTAAALAFTTLNDMGAVDISDGNTFWDVSLHTGAVVHVESEALPGAFRPAAGTLPSASVSVEGRDRTFWQAVCEAASTIGRCFILMLK